MGKWATCLKLFLGALLVCLAYPSTASQNAAEIIHLKGHGEYRLPPKAVWGNAQIKQRLQASTLLRTGDLSSMGLLFADQTQIRLGANSMFQIKAVESDGKGKTFLKLKRGKSWSRSKRQAKSLILETPSALAAIHGTDWVMEVDDDGKSTLTVLDGSVHFSNEFGAVTVGENEQAVASPGSSPVKRQLIHPKERVQWVNHHRVRLEAYPSLKTELLSPALSAAVNALQAENYGAARTALEQEAANPKAKAAAWLLLADLAQMDGDWELAKKWLSEGHTAHPDDPRFAANQVRLLILQDQMTEARGQLAKLLARNPNEPEALLVRGELSRLDGQFEQAMAAYTSATTAQPDEARAWLGKGVLWRERDHHKPARNALTKAIELDPSLPATLGELAALETQADRLDQAEAQYQNALAAQPDDYVALTGLGLLRLKQGRPEAALEALLKAAVIEPGYARTLIYTAVAYYQLGRTQHALDTLSLAAEADPLDPLPHLLKSLIHQDQIEPMAAISAARDAQRRMPFLKSVEQLAHDRKGTANAGSALALMGLEAWAGSYAQNAYLPFWAGSHLFLANRYEGHFLRESELLQGYLTDPVFFGSSPRRQSLVQRPGHDLALGIMHLDGEEISLTEPSFVANGYQNEGRPWAYFFEAIGSQMRPGDQPIGADAVTMTAALGAKPTPELGVFLFGNYILAEADSPGEAAKRDLDGYEARMDAGIRYRFSPDVQTWAKIGLGRNHTRDRYYHPEPGVLGECSEWSPFIGTCEFDHKPENEDIAIRHTFRARDRHLISLGWELARQDYAYLSRSVGASVATDDLTATLRTKDEDRSRLFYLSDHWQFNEDLLLQMDITHADYRKHRDSHLRYIQSGTAYATNDSYRGERDDLYPRLGFSYSAMPGLTLRGAYQQWLRPISPHGLAPVATAGVVLNDQWLLPGGELSRGRLQAEWEINDRTFTSVWYDRMRISNLSEGVGTVLNQRQPLAELDRLQQSAFENLTSIEALEGQAYFAKGRVRMAGMQANRIISDRISLAVGYVRSRGENLGSLMRGQLLPLLPKHRVSLGLTWFPISRFRIQGQMIYRTERFQNEMHTARLSSGWEGLARFSWSKPDREIEIEGFMSGLFQKDLPDSFGAKLLWRF